MNNSNKRVTPWNVIDKLLSKWRYRFIMPFLGSQKVVCDVGCGQNAYFLEKISHLIKKGYGYDPNLKLSKIMSDNVILVDSLDDIQEKCDAILLLAVLEHLVYPAQVNDMLKKIHVLLHSGGTLIVTTPDKRAQKTLELLAYRLHVINEEEIRDHKHYFDKKELVDLLVRSEFKDVTHRYFQCGLNNLVICKKR